MAPRKVRPRNVHVLPSNLAVFGGRTPDAAGAIAEAIYELRRTAVLDTLPADYTASLILEHVAHHGLELVLFQRAR